MTSTGLIVSSGTIQVFNGGLVRSTTLNDKANINISSGGRANDTTVNFGGDVFVYSGGSASATTVKSGAAITVSNGGSAYGTRVSSGGRMTIRYYSAGASGHAEADNTSVIGGSMTVSSSGIASRTTLEGKATMIISGGYANYTWVNSGGSVTVISGGTANNITLYKGASMYVSGGEATCATVNAFGSLYVSFGGVTYDTTVNRGIVHVSSGGRANSTTLNSGGDLTFYSGGRANSTTLNSGGSAFIYSGGVTYDTTVNQGGDLTVYSGGKVTGRLSLDAGAVVSANVGAIIDFNITEVKPDNPVQVSGLDLIQGTPTYTLTTSQWLTSGTYNLADGADLFNGVISVVDDGGTPFGTLSLDDSLILNGMEYTLSLTGGTLSVTLSDSEPGPGPGPDPGPGPEPEPEYVTVGYFPGRYMGGSYAYLAREMVDMNTGNDLVHIYVTGADMQDLPVDPSWFIEGVGDFNADGRDDFLRVNFENYVVADMTQENGTFVPQVLNFKNDGWDILGIGDFNGNGSDDVLIANPTGASETVGLLGYWESGVTWTLINGYSPEWECVSTGDFNGDGKCDMLWRNSFVGEGDLIYNAYCTWIVDNPVDWRMVSVANPREWDFLCSGDFDGNGSHDIAMINGEGVVGIWGVGDGYLNSWSILSAVDRSSWQLAGVGDFNGDGTDDIAWASDALSLAGYWQINDKQLTAWSNIANLA